VATPEKLVPWLEQLAGLEAARPSDALGEFRTWSFEHLNAELLERPDLDTLTAAVLLVEFVRALCAQGVERTKLMKKLRDTRTSAQFWPAWAEIRAAAILIGRDDLRATIEMEPDAPKGKHADFRVTHEDGHTVDIEFKAVGLSDVELEWHRAASRYFNRLLPPAGLATYHSFVDTPKFEVPVPKRAEIFDSARKLVQQFLTEFPGWADVRGVQIVAHESQPSYLKRAASRLSEAIGQMTAATENWLGLWWGNGVVLADTTEILSTASAPDRVAGVVSIYSIASTAHRAYARPSCERRAATQRSSCGVTVPGASFRSTCCSIPTLGNWPLRRDRRVQRRT